MIKLSKILIIFTSTLLFIIFLQTSGKALPLTLNVYGSVGMSYSKDHLSGGSIAGDIKDDFVIRDNKGKNLNFAFGISPNLPIPIISSLRLEISYTRGLENGLSDSLTGASIYYDVNLYPFITPYVGISFLYSNPEVAIHGNQSIKEKVNQGLTGFNVGVSMGLPAFPLAVYGEYRYAIPGIFKNELNFNKNSVNYSSSNYNLSMFMVGIRYYFL